MQVQVRLFARYREAAGRDRVELDLPEGGTVETAWEAVTSRVPSLSAYRPFTLFAVDNDYVGPERPPQIADNYAKRVQQEQAGWASQEELLAQLEKANPRMSAAVLQPYVRYGTKKRADGRIEWKRDPQLVKGFVATDLWRFVRNIKSPILYIIGGRSNIVPAETQNELRKTLPNAQLITIPDVGHYPSDEKTDEVVAIVNRFLLGETVGK